MKKTDWLILALVVVIAIGALFAANKLCPSKSYAAETYTIGEAEIDRD